MDGFCSSEYDGFGISKKWAFEFTLIIIIIMDIKRFLTQGSGNIKLYIDYAGYSKRFGVLHHHQFFLCVLRNPNLHTSCPDPRPGTEVSSRG